MAYPWVRNATRLHQYDPLQELDSSQPYASLHIRRPHELDDPRFSPRERVPLGSFILVRTSAIQRRRKE